MTAIIHQFDPQIYPRLIWVVIGEKSASAISDRFENITDMDDTSAADTQSTYDITNKGVEFLSGSPQRRTLKISSTFATNLHMRLWRYSIISVDALIAVTKSHSVIWSAGYLNA